MEGVHDFRNIATLKIFCLDSSTGIETIFFKEITCGERERERESIHWTLAKEKKDEFMLEFIY